MTSSTSSIAPRPPSGQHIVSEIPRLKVSNLSKVYSTNHGPLAVLNKINFSVDAGESVALVGSSGSGKTTLLAICAGLDLPTSGEIEIDGISFRELDDLKLSKIRNQKIGFVFQNYQLIHSLTALENVLVPAELGGDFAAESRAHDLLLRVGLIERTSHYPSQLSGGEQQRVAIARAFINNPSLILADEPTGNLDAETRSKIIELLFELNKQNGTSLLIATHDTELAELADRILTIRAGALAPTVTEAK